MGRPPGRVVLPEDYVTDETESGVIAGRRAELRALGRLVTRVAESRGGVGWVSGEPGIGTSAVLDATLARAAGLGCMVRRGAASELLQPFPLRLLAGCLGISGQADDPAAREIAGLLRGGPTAAGTIDPVLAAGERMLDLVHGWCARGPVVLAVEDLHWADDPSLLFWSRLARATEQLPLLLLGAARPHQHVRLDQLRDLVAAQGGLLLDLGPMDSDSVADLAGRIAGARPGTRLRRALRGAGGNPGYVTELVGALVRDGLLTVTADEAELPADAPASPASLPAAISGRLGFVPAPTRRTLRMAAVLGREFDAGELAIVTGQPIAELADVLAGAVAGGVLSDAGDRLRFRHELVREALLEETPEPIRRAVQGEFARLLAQAGRGAEVVARHLAAAPGTTGDWAVTWLAKAPMADLHAFPQAAAELLSRAVDTVDGDDRRWEALATRLARLLSWLGRDEEAGQVGIAVVRRAGDPAVAAGMRIQVIRSAGRRQRWAEALPFAAASPADDALPPPLRARLGAWSAVALSSAGRAAAGTAAARDALRRAMASPDPLTVGYARHAAARCFGPGHRAGHLEAALAALATLPGHDPEALDLRMTLLAEHALDSSYLARRAQAEAALAQGLTLADRASPGQAAAFRAAAAGVCYRYGRWDEALGHLGRIGPELPETGHVSAGRDLAALIALQRGDRDRADACLAGRGAARSPGGPALTLALALRAEADGDPGRALELMSGLVAVAPGPGPGERQDELPQLVRLALAAGEDGVAKAAVALAEADLAADGGPSRAIAAAFCQALLADDPAGLLAVAAAGQEYGWLPHRALALEEAAVRLAEAGDAVGARRALTEAAGILDGLGAAWRIRRADQRLRPYGVRRGPRSAHRRASSGWAALTPGELRIARLIARGRSNPDIAGDLFLSPRTVQAHVSSILAKLQLRSRLEIARAAQEELGRPA
jgi:DNA-binding CsgD family transcriptional regulator